MSVILFFVGKRQFITELFQDLSSVECKKSYLKKYKKRKKKKEMYNKVERKNTSEALINACENHELEYVGVKKGDEGGNTLMRAIKGEMYQKPNESGVFTPALTDKIFLKNVFVENAFSTGLKIDLPKTFNPKNVDASVEMLLKFPKGKRKITSTIYLPKTGKPIDELVNGSVPANASPDVIEALKRKQQDQNLFASKTYRALVALQKEESRFFDEFAEKKRKYLLGEYTATPLDLINFAMVGENADEIPLLVKNELKMRPMLMEEVKPVWLNEKRAYLLSRGSNEWQPKFSYIAEETVEQIDIALQRYEVEKQLAVVNQVPVLQKALKEKLLEFKYDGKVAKVKTQGYYEIVPTPKLDDCDKEVKGPDGKTVMMYQMQCKDILMPHPKTGAIITPSDITEYVNNHPAKWSLEIRKKMGLDGEVTNQSYNIFIGSCQFAISGIFKPNNQVGTQFKYAVSPIVFSDFHIAKYVSSKKTIVVMSTRELNRLWKEKQEKEDKEKEQRDMVEKITKREREVPIEKMPVAKEGENSNGPPPNQQVSVAQ